MPVKTDADFEALIAIRVIQLTKLRREAEAIKAEIDELDRQWIAKLHSDKVKALEDKRGFGDDS